MPVTIMLMSGRGVPPFYVNDGPGVAFTNYERTRFQEHFALPDDVMTTLLTWDEAGASCGASEDDRARWVESGRAAARALRAHLGPDVELRYVAAGEIVPEHY